MTLYHTTQKVIYDKGGFIAVMPYKDNITTYVNLIVVSTHVTHVAVIHMIDGRRMFLVPNSEFRLYFKPGIKLI